MKKNKNVVIPPEYKVMLEEIGNQLKERKSLLVKRVLLITWPILALIASLIILGQVTGEESATPDVSDERSMAFVITYVVLFVLALLYGWIMGFIFEIEKQIWIDSYFDKIKLSAKESWQLAKKIFWPAFSMRVKIIAKYYLLPIVVFLLILFFGGGALIKMTSASDNVSVVIVWLALIILTPLIIWIYAYAMKIKLRYTWFIFLDTYSPTFSFQALIKEMNDLNSIAKSDTFKKSLVANVGTDSARVLADVAITTITSGIARFGGKAGEVIGSVTQIYGRELARQTASLSNVTSQYILYRFASKQLHGSEQRINQSLYGSRQPETEQPATPLQTPQAPQTPPVPPTPPTTF